MDGVRARRRAAGGTAARGLHAARARVGVGDAMVRAAAALATAAFVLCCLRALGRLRRRDRTTSRSAAWLAEAGSPLTPAQFALLRLGAVLCGLLVVAGVT